MHQVNYICIILYNIYVCYNCLIILTLFENQKSIRYSLMLKMNLKIIYCPKKSNWLLKQNLLSKYHSEYSYQDFLSLKYRYF